MDNFTVTEFSENLARKNFSEIAKKYYCRLPLDLLDETVANTLEDLDLLETFVRVDWQDDGHGKDGLYLVRAGSGYAVFSGERGLRHQEAHFSTLRDAFKFYLDHIFNLLGHRAPDATLKLGSR